jgi:hypothetical protein
MAMRSTSPSSRRTSPLTSAITTSPSSTNRTIHRFGGLLKPGR